jgi:hypothetical protein
MDKTATTLTNTPDVTVAAPKTDCRELKQRRFQQLSWDGVVL